MWHWQGYGGLGILEWLMMAVMMLLMFGGLILLIGLVIWAVVRATRGSSGPVVSGGAVREEEALETLRRRYARGEITREEYTRMRQDLESP